MNMTTRVSGSYILRATTVGLCVLAVLLSAACGGDARGTNEAAGESGGVNLGEVDGSGSEQITPPPIGHLVALERVESQGQGAFAQIGLCRAVAMCNAGIGLYRVVAIEFDPENATLPWYNGLVSWVRLERLASWTSLIEAPENVEIPIDGYVDQNSGEIGYTVSMEVGDVYTMGFWTKSGITVNPGQMLFEEVGDAVGDRYGLYGDLGVATHQELGAMLNELFEAVWPVPQQFLPLEGSDVPFEEKYSYSCPFDFPLAEPPMEPNPEESGPMEEGGIDAVP